MARADWTYELPPGTGDSVWLEEYLVYDRDGEPGGKVFAVLEHAGRRWLGIERSHLPARHDRRAIPYDAVERVDHDNLAVHLSLGAEQLDRSLELDPAQGVEQGGEARRVVEVPPAELPRPRDAGAPGPVDRLVASVATIAGLFGTLALLAVFTFWGTANSTDALPYFAVPGVLLGGSALLAYRAWSRPWSREPAARRHPPTR